MGQSASASHVHKHQAWTHTNTNAIMHNRKTKCFRQQISCKWI